MWLFFFVYLFLNGFGCFFDLLLASRWLLCQAAPSGARFRVLPKLCPSYARALSKHNPKNQQKLERTSEFLRRTAVYFSFAQRYGQYPTHNRVPDTRDNWACLLSNLKELDPDQKSSSGCIRAAEFLSAEDCLSLDKITNKPRACRANVKHVWGAIYDLDDWPHGVLNPQQIWEAFGGYRLILWTSFNHTPDKPRYKAFLPFTHPLPLPDYEKFYWSRIKASSGGLGESGDAGLGAESQGNGERLAYIGTVARGLKQYAQWGEFDGPRMDVVSRFGEVPSGIELNLPTSYDHIIAPLNPDRSAWISDAAAITRAEKYFSTAAQGVDPGARHAHLMKWACRLFWDFWLNEDQVFDILSKLNRGFTEPKDISEVRAEVNAGYKRTRGDAAVTQLDKDKQPKEPGCMRSKEKPPDSYKLADAVNRLQRDKTSKTKADGKLLSLVTEERKTGGWYVPDDPVSFYKDTAALLGKCFSKTSYEALFEVIRPSWEHATAQETISELELKQTIQQAINKVEQATEQAHLEVEEDRQARILEALGDRNTPYTDQELEQLAGMHNTTKDIFLRRLIIKVGRAFYISKKGSYTSTGFDSLSLYSKAKVLLSPFTAYDSNKLAMGEIKEKTLNEFQDDYVTIASHMRTDLNAAYSQYHEKDDEFVEATIRINQDIVPIDDAFARGFIDSFPHAELLKTWLSHLTDLSRPLQALFLEGTPNGGKTLFARALSKLYTNKKQGFVVPMTEAVDRFSTSWLYNPLFFADERLPELFDSDPATFREHITMGNRHAERKGMQKTAVDGYLRYVLLTNEKDALPKSKKHAVDNDIEATRERIFYIEMGEGPKQYLEQFTWEQRNTLISENKLANYVAFLTVNKTTSLARFPFESPDAPVFANMNKQDEKSDALEWLLAELQKVIVTSVSNVAALPGASLHSNSIQYYRYKGNQKPFLGVSLSGMCKDWSTDRQHLMYKTPRPRQLKATLSCVSHTVFRKQQEYRRNNARFLVLDPTKLIDQANEYELSGELMQSLLQSYFAQNSSPKQLENHTVQALG